MAEVVVRDNGKDGVREEPGEAARKRAAVDLIRNHDGPLRWSARRYSICEEDAEDAYQRGIEILLSKAPNTDPKQLLPWTRTVIKHEALAIRKSRERIMARPRQHDDQPDDDWVALIPATGDGPDELAVRKERIERSKEALAQLKPAELKALTQLAEGFSYREIGNLNDWSHTKVNRCLAEGRARFRSAFHQSESGERCDSFVPLLSACCDGELEPEQVADLEKHLAACGHCRSTLRAYRAAPRAAAALAPALPVSHSLWERIQEVVIAAQVRVQGFGRGSDSALQGVMASGGTRGTGLAAAAKLAAICAGTAGTAAVCVSTGVLPAAELLPQRNESAHVRQVEAAPEPPRHQVGFLEPPSKPETPAEPVREPVVEPAEPEAAPEAAAATPTPPPPPPTPTEVEFTPEAAGSPVASPPPPPPKPTSSPVPTSNGGMEFSP